MASCRRNIAQGPSGERGTIQLFKSIVQYLHRTGHSTGKAQERRMSEGSFDFPSLNAWWALSSCELRYRPARSAFPHASRHEIILSKWLRILPGCAVDSEPLDATTPQTKQLGEACLNGRAERGLSWPFTPNTSGVQSLRRVAAFTLFPRDFNAASALPRPVRNVRQPVAAPGSASVSRPAG